MVHTIFKSNIKAFVEEHFSSENKLSGIVANDEVKVPSTSPQTVKQIEVIKEVVLLEVSIN